MAPDLTTLLEQGRDSLFGVFLFLKGYFAEKRGAILVKREVKSDSGKPPAVGVSAIQIRLRQRYRKQMDGIKKRKQRVLLERKRDVEK